MSDNKQFRNPLKRRDMAAREVGGLARLPSENLGKIGVAELQRGKNPEQDAGEAHAAKGRPVRRPSKVNLRRRGTLAGDEGSRKTELPTVR